MTELQLILHNELHLKLFAMTQSAEILTTEHCVPKKFKSNMECLMRKHYMGQIILGSGLEIQFEHLWLLKATHLSKQSRKKHCTNSDLNKAAMSSEHKGR
ncbi:hypothetical protein AMECASPLE_017384 [Ameca splendens]|uniref:Uncharacterized protein n=1 Tax=Ameca splendens TaxID=208324 RepID=A0ABV0ZNL1_9TELE